MATVKFNVKGVDSGSNRPLIKPAVYRAKIVECSVEQPDGKDPRIEVVTEITAGDYKGERLRKQYINLVQESVAWRLRQFLEAVGIVTDKKESGQFDPAKLVGKEVKVRVKSKMDEEWGAQNEVGTWIGLDDDDTEDLTDADEANDEAENEGDVPGADEDEDESEEEDGDGEDANWTEEELNELDDEDIVLYAFGGTDEDDDEIEGLLDEDRRSEFVVKKKKGKKTVTTVKRDELIAAMLEAQDEDEDGDDESDVPDYDSMELAELRALCKKRGLSTKGAEKVLRTRLQKDDEPF